VGVVVRRPDSSGGVLSGAIPESQRKQSDNGIIREKRREMAEGLTRSSGRQHVNASKRPSRFPAVPPLCAALYAD
jgi:hypothetical protein